ncbi:unnamed protein product [Orchesella dallaii]|uniref:Uncharacterized protein n=1 Tax=Orchesella dallaii TaxID=48710 RepID=A0ABP1RB13_9HEXA
MDNSGGSDYWDSLLVGDEPCTFVNIVNVLIRSAGSVLLWYRLMDVARCLPIPHNVIMRLKSDLALDRLTYPSAFFSILETWRSIELRNAKLRTLIYVLGANNLKDCADSLRNEFGQRHGIATSRIGTSQGKSLDTPDDTDEVLGIPNMEKHDIQQHPLNVSNSLPPNLTKLQQSKETLTPLSGTGVRYDPTTRLGDGATSNVYKGYYGKIPAAVKIVESKHFDIYHNEINVWQHMKQTIEENNLNIVTLLFWQELKTSKYLIVMERATCDLADRVKHLKLSAIPSQLIKTEHRKITGFIHEVAKGLKWMHECKNPIIHRDVKPENILIFATSSREIAKLGDFGVSRKLQNSLTGTTTGGQGTFSWMAPEAITAFQFNQKFHTTKAVDIFSLGMTAHFAMSLGNHPFEESQKHGKFVMMNISDPNIMPGILGHPNYAADHLLQWMMTKPVDGRPNIQQVVQHPCFWDWKRTEEFVCAVARCFDRNHDINIQNCINKNYKLRIHWLGKPVSWLDRLGRNVQTILFYWKKDYASHEDLIMKLVELMRDKYMHYRDMMEKNTLPTNDVFTFQGSFDDGKYWDYFITTYPEVVIHLFCQIANRNEFSLETLKREYFKNFNQVPDWIN